MENSEVSSMETNNDDNKDKKSGTLTRVSVRDKLITKKKIKRKSVNFMSRIRLQDFILQSLNSIDHSHPVAVASRNFMCNCQSWDLERAALAKCKYCLSIEKDPTKQLPKLLIVTFCRGCGNYFSSTGRTRASPQSTELLNFLVKILLEHCFPRNGLVLLGAQFAHTDPDPLSKKSININLCLQMTTPTGEKVDLTWTTEYLIRCQVCRTCLIKDVVNQRSVVELRPYGTSNNRLLKLEQIILRYGPTFRLVEHKKSGKSILLFFPEERDVRYFVSYISTITPIQPTKVCRMLLPGRPRDRLSNNLHTCLPLLICPLRYKDLVFLPSKISAKLGNNLGPLVICTTVNSEIRLLDPFNMRVCGLSSAQYWDEPFEALKTREELVEFIVLNVEVVSKGPNFALADIEVARVADFGKNDVIYTVRSHLGEILKPDDHALGYVLNWENINHVEVQKYKKSLPDVVLVRRKRPENEQPMMVEKTRPENEQPMMMVEKTTKNTSPDYMEFLSNLDENSEAMFRLSLNCRNNDGMETSDMGKGKNVDLDLERMLADLGLSDEEDGASNRKK